MKIYHCRGNLSFATNSEEIRKKILAWSWSEDKTSAPRCLEDLRSRSFAELVMEISDITDRDLVARTAFAGEWEDEDERPQEPLDVPSDDEEETIPVLPQQTQDLLNKEEEMLEGLPLPGVPVSEAERRKLWLQIPKRTRAAIRKHASRIWPLPSYGIDSVVACSKDAQGVF